MTKEEFLQKLTDIGTSESDVDRRTLITELNDEVNNLYDNNFNLTNANETYKKDNEKLKEANMKLFLQVSGNNDSKQDDPIIEDNKPREPRKFEDLFNEKGMIK